MTVKRLFITGPSRSGSSLLTYLLNSSKHISVVNEPEGGARIMDRDHIIGLCERIRAQVVADTIVQRTRSGEETTDTFPNEGLAWTRLPLTGKDVQMVGFKASFPSFTYRTFFDRHLEAFGPFIRWWRENEGGTAVAIVRNPVFSILSWKSTFPRLRASTEDQCRAWNDIAQTLVDARGLVRIVRYEDMIENETGAFRSLCRYLGVPPLLERPLPAIFGETNSLAHFSGRAALKEIDMQSEADLIQRECGELARELGYSL